MPVLDQLRLEGRVALVTGASRGLGRAMALGLAASDYVTGEVVFVDGGLSAG